MKVITITISISLILFSLLANAQEQQKDAVIDETIKWINEYGFENTVALNDTLLKPKQIFFGKAVRDLFYFYNTKDDESVTVVFEDKLTNKMTISIINGEYRIHISDLFTAGYTNIT